MIEKISEILSIGDVRTKATVARSVKYSISGAVFENNMEIEFYIEIASLMINLSTESDPDIKKYALEGLTALIKYDW